MLTESLEIVAEEVEESHLGTVFVFAFFHVRNQTGIGGGDDHDVPNLQIKANVQRSLIQALVIFNVSTFQCEVWHCHAR